MSEVFASLAIGTAWEKLSSFLQVFAVSSLAPSSSSWVAMDLEELRKLERTMRRILATLHDADEHWNIREESTKLRLRELKELSYDIEDIVNKYEHVTGQYKVEDLKRSAVIHYTSKRKRQEENEAYSVDPGVVEVPYELASQVTKITERFNEIMHFSNDFSLTENDGERLYTSDINSSRHTSSFPFDDRILGRDKEKDKIIDDKLLHREGKIGGSHVSVLSIVGMEGLGKTTLAQLVYNDPRLRQSFEAHAWVYVSEHFDVNTITRNIIISLTEGSCEYTELADLQEILADEIKDKKVLLVLDDVWNERVDCWELLCTPISTARICQIILTTRSEAVARLVQTMPFYRPSKLSFDESWTLFKQVVFPINQEFDTPANLIDIGKSIVKKCKGLPLAIKTLASMLRNETDENTWEDVLENELWDWEQSRYKVVPALELSYKHVPIH